MKLKSALIGLAALGGIALGTGAASAMPIGLAAGSVAHAATIDQVRYVCTPSGRCFWRPNSYGAYGFYGGPRVHVRPYGYRGGWHRGWHHGRRW